MAQPTDPPAPTIPPATVIKPRGELIDLDAREGHTLAWLWPQHGPEAAHDPRVFRRGSQLAALTLRFGESLTIRREMTQAPTLTPIAEGWEICVPSDKIYGDVSRAPTRFTLDQDGQLTLQTEAQGPQRFWVDLLPVDGPSGPTVVAPWSAAGVGPVVLWHVPRDQSAAWLHLTDVHQEVQQTFSAPGFRCYSAATMDVVSHLRRRAKMRLLVPKAATTERWEAGQPFVLAGEPGCGKTTLAKAVYSVLGSQRFAAVHPVAVEQEVDLVALTGCSSFAHDGIKVPDQEGHLDVVTHPDGVILIDEIHTLDHRLKQHLTDLMTEWTFRPRGDNTRHKKVRGLIVFATNRPQLLRDPLRFPPDLFARMGGEAGIIEVPPLRQRRWEVPALAAAVLEELTPPLRLAPDAVRKLLLHAWPLNHWELEDVLREAHSVAAAQRQAEILPHHLKLKPPASPEAGVDRGPAVDGELAAWRFPATTGWPELFVGLYHHGSFAALRDAWQRQLGARNAATVNRRIGRLVRCDRCEPVTCPRCFAGALAQTEPGQLLARLEQLGLEAGVPAGQVSAWIATALGELVVGRSEAFRTEAIQDALNASRATGQGLVTLIGALRQRLASS
jgi:transcriptional regulator with AAA-type ATPase domain